MGSPLIKEVILENFMSYRYARVSLGPGVNVVVGPNGAGKSSLLLAISVALGQSYTERGRRLGDLVRHGEDMARVTLVVSNEPRGGRRPFPRFRSDEIYLTRYLRRDGTYWYEANGRPITKTELQRCLSRIGLNPENMLIIMHQGLVEEFVFLSPQERLRVVEDAVGLGAFRRGVLAAMKELGEVVEAEKKARELLRKVEETLEYWEEQYSRYVKLAELQRRLEDLRRELAWARVRDRERQLEEASSRLREVEDVIRRLSGKIRTLRSRAGELLGEADRLEKSVLKGEAERVRDLKVTLLEYAETLAEVRVSEYVLEALGEERREIEKEVRKLRRKLEEEVGEAEALGPRVDTERHVAEIEEDIRDVELSIAALGEVPREVVDAYERYKEEYDLVRRRAEEAARNRERAQRELEHRKSLWRSKIEEVVEEVNRAYAEYLARLGGVGEVRLVNADDIEQAGLLVTVGFKGASPTELNPYTQSGGERTTAVMCFLLALQDRVRSPFRALDEFEVHMDPRNREAVLRLIFEIAERNRGVQYLVITPQPIEPLPEGATLIVVQKVKGVSYARRYAAG